MVRTLAGTAAKHPPSKRPQVLHQRPFIPGAPGEVVVDVRRELLLRDGLVVVDLEISRVAHDAGRVSHMAARSARGYRGRVARVTIFGAGAMGTAFAMHAARAGLPTSLWANEHDLAAYAAMREERKHPLLPNTCPTASSCVAPTSSTPRPRTWRSPCSAANSAGARSLASMVREHVAGARVAVSVAKGLEPTTGKRMSEVYGEEIPGAEVVAVGGPCLARELAEGLPTAAVWAAGPVRSPRRRASRSTTATISSRTRTTWSASSSVR